MFRYSKGHLSRLTLSAAHPSRPRRPVGCADAQFVLVGLREYVNMNHSVFYVCTSPRACLACHDLRTQKTDAFVWRAGVFLCVARFVSVRTCPIVSGRPCAQSLCLCDCVHITAA